MLTQEDLQNIKDLFEDQNHHIDRLEQKMHSGFWGLDNRMDGIEHRMDGIEQHMDGMEHRMGGIEHRMGGIEQRMDGMEYRMDGIEQRMDGMEHRMDGIEHRMNGIEQHMDGMEHRMGGIEQRMDGMEYRMDGIEQQQNNIENYMHDKFAVIENDLIPKVNTLYETTDLYVKRIECRKQIAEIENKLDYVEPLVEIVQFHGEKLEQHETIIKKLVETV